MITQQKNFVLRNREHQRQSRARRKDLISELQSRIQKYEKEGARVTVEVQAAARRVAEENRDLRDLLKIHGVSAAVVDAHLASTRQTATSMVSSSIRTIHPCNNYGWRESQPGGSVVKAAAGPAPKLARSAAQYGPSTDTNDPLKATTNLKAGNPSTELDLTLSQEARQMTSQSYISPPIQDHRAHLDYPELDPSLSLSDDLQQRYLPHPQSPSSQDHLADAEDQMLTDDGSYKTQAILARGELTSPLSSSNNSATRTLDKESADETDCETAARIIATMRGHGDHESIWPELGCSVEGCSIEKKCMVRNDRIFQMA